MSPNTQPMDVLFSLWQAKCGNRQSPHMNEVSMINDSRLQGNVTVLDVMDNQEFRYVYIGTALVNAAGQNNTGLIVNEALYGDAVGDILDKLYFVAAFNMPMRFGVRVRCGENWRELMILEVPLSDEAGRVRRIVGTYVVVDQNTTGPLGTGPREIEVIDFDDCQDSPDDCLKAFA